MSRTFLSFLNGNWDPIWNVWRVHQQANFRPVLQVNGFELWLVAACRSFLNLLRTSQKIQKGFLANLPLISKNLAISVLAQFMAAVQIHTLCCSEVKITFISSQCWHYLVWRKATGLELLAFRLLPVAQKVYNFH